MAVRFSYEILFRLNRDTIRLVRICRADKIQGAAVLLIRATNSLKKMEDKAIKQQFKFINMEDGRLSLNGNDEKKILMPFFFSLPCITAAAGYYGFGRRP